MHWRRSKEGLEKPAVVGKGSTAVKVDEAEDEQVPCTWYILLACERRQWVET